MSVGVHHLLLALAGLLIVTHPNTHVLTPSLPADRSLGGKHYHTHRVGGERKRTQSLFIDGNLPDTHKASCVSFP